MKYRFLLVLSIRVEKDNENDENLWWKCNIHLDVVSLSLSLVVKILSFLDTNWIFELLLVFYMLRILMKTVKAREFNVPRSEKRNSNFSLSLSNFSLSIVRWTIGFVSWTEKMDFEFCACFINTQNISWEWNNFGFSLSKFQTYRFPLSLCIFKRIPQYRSGILKITPDVAWTIWCWW